ncbi:uncharacterized protein [Vulpes vulpes]|uniref:Collagen alpha-1(I) chain-like n=1 Tax=Vulpes vulpes TaxID=9627 RepID=A0ABM4Z8R5_VULVU
MTVAATLSLANPEWIDPWNGLAVVLGETVRDGFSLSQTVTFLHGNSRYSLLPGEGRAPPPPVNSDLSRSNRGAHGSAQCREQDGGFDREQKTARSGRCCCSAEGTPGGHAPEIQGKLRSPRRASSRPVCPGVRSQAPGRARGRGGWGPRVPEPPRRGLHFLPPWSAPSSRLQSLGRGAPPPSCCRERGCEGLWPHVVCLGLGRKGRPGRRTLLARYRSPHLGSSCPQSALPIPALPARAGPPGLRVTSLCAVPRGSQESLPRCALQLGTSVLADPEEEHIFISQFPFWNPPRALQAPPPGPPSPRPPDFHPIRRPPHGKQRLPLGRPGARGPAPGVVCEWGEGRGRGGPEPREPDASSGELRDSEALLCAPSRRAAAAAAAAAAAGGRRDTRAGASRGWRGQAQAAGSGPSRLRTQCDWISKKNSLSSWLQSADRTRSEDRPLGRNLGAELSGLEKERGSRKGGGGGGGGGGEQSLEARRRSSTASAAASARGRRRRLSPAGGRTRRGGACVAVRRGPADFGQTLKGNPRRLLLLAAENAAPLRRSGRRRRPPSAPPARADESGAPGGRPAAGRRRRRRPRGAGTRAAAP